MRWPSGTAASSSRPAMPRSSRTSARRPSRSRRSPWCGRVRTSTTRRSRSSARRTSPHPSSSRSCAGSSPTRPPTEAELECGGAPTPIEHNCSGKHAGFLALCRARDWPTPGYRPAGASLPAGDAARGRGGGRGRAVVPGGRGGRLRRADLRAAARARRARFARLGLARRRPARRARDAGAPGPPARTRSRRTPS